MLRGPIRTEMARPAAFVGEDRRRAPAPAGVGRVFVLAAAAVLAAASGLAALAAGGDPLDAGDARSLRLVLDTASAVVALAVFTLCGARRQLAGEAPALWVGTAAAGRRGRRRCPPPSWLASGWPWPAPTY
jgi:hypothetical protein